MTARPRILDFGFVPEVSPHHFLVAGRRDGGVLIGERFGWAEDDAEPDRLHPKVLLDGYRWERVAEQAAVDFNRRIRSGGGRAARWKRGETLLAAHYGKELTLLAWAIEGADPTVIPAMFANWAGLAPEERWWLYTTINATFVWSEEEPRGWRKAIKIAFAENPVHAVPSALLSAPLPVSDEDRQAGRRRRKSGQQAAPKSQIAMDLPGVQEDDPDYDASGHEHEVEEKQAP